MVQTASTLPNATIDPNLVILSDVVPGGSYWYSVIKRGNTLRITDLEGSQGVSMLCYNADHPIERYNAADTGKIQFNTFLKKGMVLYSDMGRVLMSITEDSFGDHDTLSGCSNVASNAAKYSEGDHKNSRDNFLRALAKNNLGKKDIMPNVNLFSRVAIAPNGAMQYVEGCEKPGSLVDLRAEMNVLVVLSNCPHVLHPGSYAPKPIQVAIWKSPPPAADDLCHTANPEVVRGFVNTDALFAQ